MEDSSTRARELIMTSEWRYTKQHLSFLKILIMLCQIDVA